MSKPLATTFAQQGDKYIGTPYTMMDCQAFYERMLADIGVKKDLKGSNAWFRAMDWVGTPEVCKQRFGTIPIGATLFIWADDGGEIVRGYTDGKGNASHIGVYTGRNGGAIHSSASKGCVAYSTFKGKTIRGGWNRVGLTSLVSYGKKVDDMIIGTPTDIPAAAGSATTSNLATVTGGRLNLRKEPGGTIIARLDNGDQVEIIADHGDWVEVRHVRQGYVMKKYLKEG